MQKRMEGNIDAHREGTGVCVDLQAKTDYNLGPGLEMLLQELLEHSIQFGCSQSLILRRKVGERRRRMDHVSIV